MIPPRNSLQLSLDQPFYVLNKNSSSFKVEIIANLIPKIPFRLFSFASCSAMFFSSSGIESKENFGFSSSLSETLIFNTSDYMNDIITVAIYCDNEAYITSIVPNYLLYRENLYIVEGNNISAFTNCSEELLITGDQDICQDLKEKSVLLFPFNFFDPNSSCNSFSFEISSITEISKTGCRVFGKKSNVLEAFEDINGKFELEEETSLLMKYSNSNGIDFSFDKSVPFELHNTGVFSINGNIGIELSGSLSFYAILQKRGKKIQGYSYQLEINGKIEISKEITIGSCFQEQIL